MGMFKSHGCKLILGTCVALGGLGYWIPSEWALAAPMADGALAKSCNTAERSVLLILDASGSMNARLPEGESRIEVIIPPNRQLAQGNLEASGGFGQQADPRFLGPFRVGAPVSQLRRERVQDRHDTFPRKTTVDRRL